MSFSWCVDIRHCSSLVAFENAAKKNAAAQRNARPMPVIQLRFNVFALSCPTHTNHHTSSFSTIQAKPRHPQRYKNQIAFTLTLHTKSFHLAKRFLWRATMRLWRQLSSIRTSNDADDRTSRISDLHQADFGDWDFLNLEDHVKDHVHEWISNKAWTKYVTLTTTVSKGVMNYISIAESICIWSLTILWLFERYIFKFMRISHYGITSFCEKNNNGHFFDKISTG